jgi:hypothetical protein
MVVMSFHRSSNNISMFFFFHSIKTKKTVMAAVNTVLSRPFS